MRERDTDSDREREKERERERERERDREREGEMHALQATFRGSAINLAKAQRKAAAF